MKNLKADSGQVLEPHMTLFKLLFSYICGYFRNKNEPQFWTSVFSLLKNVTHSQVCEITLICLWLFWKCDNFQNKSAIIFSKSLCCTVIISEDNFFSKCSAFKRTSFTFRNFPKRYWSNTCLLMTEELMETELFINSSIHWQDRSALRILKILNEFRIKNSCDWWYQNLLFMTISRNLLFQIWKRISVFKSFF